MQAHYESYRKSVLADALEGFEQFSKNTPTADPAQWPTTYDYLVASTRSIKLAIANKNKEEYEKWLGYHRDAMLALFGRMVGTDKKAVLDKGWKWYKFSNFCIKFDKFTLVPRHGMFPDWPAFDADEMSIILAGPRKHDAILRWKENRDKIVELSEDAGMVVTKAVPLNSINTPNYVGDWTLWKTNSTPF